MATDEEREELQSKHRKELKELRAKIQAVKSAVPKGDKKRKKQATEEIARLESETAARHTAETVQLEAGLSEDASSPSAAASATEPAVDESCGVEDTEAAATAAGAGERLSKAQRRKLKKEQEARERDERLEQAAKDAVNSDRNVEMRGLTALLTSLSLRVHEVEADGNCLYYALAYQLYNRHHEADMKSLRRQAAAFMLEHRDDFRDFISDTEVQSGELDQSADPFERYCKGVAETNMWGGQLEIQALARALNRKVVVYQAGTGNIEIGDDASSPPLRLVYHLHALGAGEHYNAAVALEGEAS